MYAYVYTAKYRKAYIQIFYLICQDSSGRHLFSLPDGYQPLLFLRQPPQHQVPFVTYFSKYIIKLNPLCLWEQKGPALITP